MMFRPKIEDPKYSHLSSYTSDLEEYCNTLESFIKYILLHMQRESLQMLGECEGCMCKGYCKGEKSVLQEWCENMDHLLFDDRFFDQGDKWRNTDKV